jgi:hypothetical protein
MANVVSDKDNVLRLKCRKINPEVMIMIIIIKEMNFL